MVTASPDATDYRRPLSGGDKRVAVAHLAEVLDVATYDEDASFSEVATAVIVHALEVKLTHGRTRLTLTFDLDNIAPPRRAPDQQEPISRTDPPDGT